MALKHRSTVILASIIAILAFISIAASIVIPRLLHLDTYREEILSEVQRSLNRPVFYEKGDFSFSPVPSLTFSKVVIKEKDGTSNFLTADKLSFRIALLPLLEKKLIIKEMQLTRPVIRLSRDKSGIFNISDLLEAKKEELPLQFKGISIKQGNITFTDRGTSPDAVTTVLEGTDLHISNLTRGKNSDFKLSTFIVEEGNKSAVTLSGSAKLAPTDKPFSETRINGRVLAKNLNAAHYWAYYSRHVPFQKVFGRLDLDTRFDGKFAEFTSKGSFRISGLRFHYPQVFHALLTPKNIQATYEMELTHNDVAVKSVAVNVDGLSVKGSCAVRDIHSGDPRIVARTIIAPFRLEEFFHYIPFGIISKDTSEFIEKNIKGGTYRVDEGRLDGRVSQILHMEKGENYNILTVRATAISGGLVDMGGGVPTFNSIKGDLVLAGKDFSLNKMSGRFGTSPFTLDGKITDYPLDTPSAYPFTALFTPQAPEVAWLLGKSRGSKLGFSGVSALHLNGEGGTANYLLSGDWNLGNAAYNLPDLINKPAGHANHLSFKGSISKDGVNAPSFQYSMPPLSLSAAAKYRSKEPRRLSLDIKSNQFAVGEIAPMLPRIRKYSPQGKMQISVRGESETAELAGMNWNGEITLAGTSFKPSETVKTVSNINGTVRFRGNTLETSKLAVMLGSSTIYGKGSLTNLDNPSFTLDFSSPSLDLADLGLRNPKGDVRAQKVQGSISLHNDDLRIRSLSAKVNNSIINLKGNVTDIRAPHMDLTVTSPFIDLDDILLLTGLGRTGTGNNRSTGMALKATINADAAKLRNVPCKKLQTVAMYEEGILYLQPIEFSAFGGKVSGKVRADIGSNATPRYQTNLSIEKMSAEQLIQSLDLRLHNEVITGTLSLQADVTAKGESSADLKKSALGNVRVHLDKGKLRRFSVLSKVFSILNFSQLLKFQLPDMVSGGMPYNRINATLSLHDGLISTNDLFIDSDAMNVSAIGKIDLIREEVDVTVGVQPLQTVDKVVNRIPIVGWILTGKDKSFITTYFEAKGKWNDPVVTAIPVKTMARGILDIFLRVFQLPGKLITDTGEVVIGK